MQFTIPHYRKTQLPIHVQSANSATELDHAFDTFQVDLPLIVIPLYMLSFVVSLVLRNTYRGAHTL
jgi:hypothetical protein